jgi:hypothetical protein
MKRITQILASVLFVITVLTVYLAFDFAINNAVSHRTSSHKRSHHDHDHLHDDIKITKKRFITPSVLHHPKKFNQTIKHHHEDEDEDHHSNDERHPRNVKQQPQQQLPLRAKPGNFHKGKTGVKVNKPQKSNKEQRKRLSTSTKQIQHKDKHHLNDNQHV